MLKLEAPRIRPELASRPASLQPGHAGAPYPTTAHVIGPYNTGTNFLAAMLAKNGVPTTDTIESPLREAAFKHYPYPVAARAMAAANLSPAAALFVVLLRNPFNWIDALSRSPYEFVYSDLVSACRIDTDEAQNQLRAYRLCLEGAMSEAEIAAAFRFESVVSYWSTFYRGYAEAHARGEISALFLQYEDLVASPGECLQIIRSALGLAPAADLVVPLDSAKSHGVTAGYLEARRKLGLSPALGLRQLLQIGQRLDPEVMRLAGYRGMPLDWMLTSFRPAGR